MDNWKYMKAEDAISGKEGALYATINGNVSQVAECKSITAKITKNKTEFKALGYRGTQHKATGWSGTGTLVIHYATSKFAKMMIDYANTSLINAGYVPYYMYRQSRCVGNLENVGWCLPEKECLYNIYMMEEIHTVLAVGAGAVTKLKEPDGAYIERIFNFKYPYEYNSRFEELIERKNRITKFYSTYN